MESQKLSEIVKICRKEGIKTFECSEFKFELATEALFPESAYTQKKRKKEIEVLKEAAPDPVLEAEKALYWSVAALDSGVEAVAS